LITPAVEDDAIGKHLEDKQAAAVDCVRTRPAQPTPATPVESRAAVGNAETYPLSSNTHAEAHVAMRSPEIAVKDRIVQALAGQHLDRELHLSPPPAPQQRANALAQPLDSSHR